MILAEHQNGFMTVLFGKIMATGLCNVGNFKLIYHMSERAFEKLLLMLYPKLQKNIIISSNSNSGLGEVFSPEMTMAITFWLFAMASYIDLTSAYGLIESSVFVVRKLFVNAVNSCDLNVQAFCDARIHSIFFSVTANGKSSDQAALEKTFNQSYHRC